ncbi:MAG: cell division protein ZapA [Candidatus Eisenbacteria bacterium]|nr:cell division protein ZapA [Candidatus Eisenbacteria bacterium]
MDASTTDSASTQGRPDAKNVVQVQILGQQLSIRGEADQAYILGVAGYVDRKMREITEKLPVASLSKVAILASLNIADELFKERASRERDGADQGDHARRLSAVIHRLDQLLDEAR